MAVESACVLFQSLEINGVLVVAPNGVHRQWAEEQITKWGKGVSFAWRLSVVNNVKDFGNWLSFTRDDSRLHWFCVNMESLIRPDTQKAIDQFKKTIGRAMLIVDESHHFSRPGAKRTAIVRGLARRFEYRRILTGTPVENSPLQAFSQFEILRREALGCRTFGIFKEEYSVTELARGPGGRRFPKIVGYKNIDRLKQHMAPLSSVVLRSDCADLPSVMQDTRVVELANAQRDLWNAVKKQELEKLDTLEYNGPISGGAAFVKLQQIEGGFLLNADRTVRDVCAGNNPKMSILLDEIQQYDGCVIVWFQFVHELEAAMTALTLDKIPCGRFHGSVKMAERDKTLSDLSVGRIKVALCQPQAGGEGRDMSAAGKIIWYSQTPDARLRSQAAERATAMGGRSVQMVDLIVPGGVDAHYAAIVTRKTIIADDLGREGLRRMQI